MSNLETTSTTFQQISSTLSSEQLLLTVYHQHYSVVQAALVILFNYLNGLVACGRPGLLVYYLTAWLAS